MNGYLLLEGGAEFGGKMVEADLRAMTVAGGREANMCILPTAAAPDHNDEHAGHNGERWFRNVGIKHITVAPVIDRATADSPSYATIIENSRFIYMLGGFPRYLGETLAGSRCAQAMRQAFEDGALVGGSSAGAMVLCEHFYDPETGIIVPGLNYIPGTCIIPHHNTFGRRWVSRLAEMLPDDLLIGIDEQTGLLDDMPNGSWSVYGGGTVTLYRKSVPTVYHRGESIPGLVA
jgi:cyanophycinase